MQKLGRFSLGIGDRFGMEGQAQLKAFEQLKAQGINVVPVWNKSYREHSIIGTNPQQQRAAADEGRLPIHHSVRRVR